MQVPFTHRILSEEFAAARLVYQHLEERLASEKRQVASFSAFAPVIALADDNDRWLHRLQGSRELAWVVRTLGADSYDECSHRRARNLQPAHDGGTRRVEAEIAHSSRRNASRRETRVGDITLGSHVRRTSERDREAGERQPSARCSR